MKFNKLYKQYLKESKLDALKRFAGLDPMSKAIFKIGNEFGLGDIDNGITWYSPNALTVHHMDGNIDKFVEALKEEEVPNFFYRTWIKVSLWGRLQEVDMVIGDKLSDQEIEKFPYEDPELAMPSLWYKAYTPKIPIGDHSRSEFDAEDIQEKNPFRSYWGPGEY
jgi:hypothetical protein